MKYSGITNQTLIHLTKLKDQLGANILKKKTPLLNRHTDKINRRCALAITILLLEFLDSITELRLGDNGQSKE